MLAGKKSIYHPPRRNEADNRGKKLVARVESESECQGYYSLSLPFDDPAHCSKSLDRNKTHGGSTVAGTVRYLPAFIMRDSYTCGNLASLSPVAGINEMVEH